MTEQKRLWERSWTKGTATQAPVAKDKKTKTLRVYTLQVFLTDGPVAKKFTGKEISRTIQIRGDQTLQALHRAIFKAFDRWEEHLHEFNFGNRERTAKRPLPSGDRPCWRIAASIRRLRGVGVISTA